MQSAKLSPGASHILATFIIIVTLVCVGTQNAISATINVTANATDSLAVNGQCSLREAITNINKGYDYHSDCVATNIPNPYGANDTINIPAGTYTTIIAGANEDLNASGDYDILKSVSILGAGAGTTIINGGMLDRVFDINNVSNMKSPGGMIVSISGVTITGGSTTGNGGGILVNGSWDYPFIPSSFTITNSIITGNTTALIGGGIYNDGYNNAGTNYSVADAVFTITNCTISNNSAGGEWGGAAGGIYNGYSTLYVTNSTITNNSALPGGNGGTGGGIYSYLGKLNLTNSTISSNTAAGLGGGIYNYTRALSASTITNSIISNNSATSGGGIHNELGALAITYSSISGNAATTVATGRGGGIKNAASLTVTNSTINGNTASFGGGIDSTLSAMVAVTNTTISGNTALYGGGVFSASTVSGGAYITNFVLTNSTVSGNTGSGYVGGITSGGGVMISNTIVANQVTGIDCSSGVKSAGHNLESGTSCSLTGTGDKQNTNPLLGALTNNGGPTQTMELLAGSPAIDAGDSAVCAAAAVNSVDQRGIVRPQGTNCDIGAFEKTAGNAYSTLTVNLTGAGTVNSILPDTPKINCPGACSALYATGSTVTLSASPSWYATTGWSGCSATGNNCSTQMTADKTITVTFSENPNARLATTPYGRIQDAYDAASGDGTIQAKEQSLVTFLEDVDFNKGYTITLLGGRNDVWGAVNGRFTVINGSYKIRSGKAIVDGIRIR